MSKKKVLLVEDYAALQSAFKIALTAEGYDVLLAGSCAEAVAAAEQSRPDIVTLDMLLPDEGGMEFLRKYSPKDHPETQVIIFSNLSSPELFAEAQQLGASRYLVKSNYTPKQLVEVISEMLKK